MKRQKRHTFLPAAGDTEAFTSSEEAWFWAMQCQIARAEGARQLAGMSLHPRPCDPDDILIVLGRLVRQGRLGEAHARTLNGYGQRLRPPDPRVRDEAEAARLWDEALDAMTTPLATKGILVIEAAA